MFNINISGYGYRARCFASPRNDDGEIPGSRFRAPGTTAEGFGPKQGLELGKDLLDGIEIWAASCSPAQTVGIKQTEDRIWLVSFMDYDLGYFHDETRRLEPLANPFGPKVLPMSSE
jgi:hypothetical protein